MFYKNERGTTLVELIISTAIGLFVIGAAYGLLITTLKKQSQNDKRIKVSRELRQAMDIIGRELRGTAVVIDASSASAITVVNQDTDNSGLLNSSDNRVKISLDSAKRLVVEKLDTSNTVLATVTRNLDIYSLTINCYSYHSAETFTDTNNNGHYDAGETFTDTDNDGVCDDGSAAHKDTITSAANYSKINVFDVTIVGRVGSEQQTLTNIIAPRNLIKQ